MAQSKLKIPRREEVHLIELLVVIAIIAILAALLCCRLTRAKQKAHGARCMSNNKQLALAWCMYANDNADRLVINGDQGAGDSWVKNKMHWNLGPGVADMPAMVNASPLASFLGNQGMVYWCPTDTYLSSVQRSAGYERRVRSVAMDAAVGDGPNKPAPGIIASGTFFFAKKMEDLTRPGPSDSWVFTDEHPDAVDDNILYVDPSLTDGFGQFTELPSSDHNGADGISFADGHAEIHKWRDARTIKPVTYQQGVGVASEIDTPAPAASICLAGAAYSARYENGQANSAQADRLYLDRIAGGHRHHRHSGGDAFTALSRAKSKGGRYSFASTI
jgi:type II secretory pathway pseudopilin PulG